MNWKFWKKWWKQSPEKARKLWVEALRSGEYEQCQNSLHKQDACGFDQYCCLGVACEVYQQHVGDLDIATHTLDDEKTYDGEFATLPHKVAKWLNIEPSGTLSEHKSVPREDEDYEGIINSLVDANDDFEFNFGQIADIIEEGKLLCFEDDDELND